MSFFNKIKQGLGFGTLEAKLNVPVQIAGASGQLEGDFVLTAKSDQQVKEIWVKLEMIKYWEETKQRRDSNGNMESYTSHESRSYELGKFSDKTPFAMKANETRTIHFVVPFQPIATPQASDSTNTGFNLGGIAVTISNVASALRNERTEYKVEGKVDLKDVAFDPGDSKNISVI
jgi:hypothetical protein